MLFNSVEFLFFFFPLVTALFFILPHKFRWLWLLSASCYFYMAFVPVYILILIFTICIDYFAGIMIENANLENKKKYLILSIIANVGVLAFFKYSNFIITNTNDIASFFKLNTDIPLLNIILPIGLSFHTFQALSYTIEVFRGNQKAERHFGIYALYVMFYPQLVAGPIERPQNLLHQFHEKKYFNYENVVTGTRWILWGLFKKVVIADRLGKISDIMYNHPHHYSGIALALGTIIFAFQIYCDFSGYSDIALGAAKVMGYDLRINFNMPYHSKSISEFWQRWHISLSSWFYDYLYNPIVTSLRNWNKLAIIFGLIFTFLISGLWHGPAWHYIVWGGIHSIALVYEMLTRKKRRKFFSKFPKMLTNFISIFCTFSYVCFGYIFFRAANLYDALFIVKKISHIPFEIKQIIALNKISFLNLPASFLLEDCFLFILFLEIADVFINKYDLKHNFGKLHWTFRWMLYYGGVIAIFYFGIMEKHQFIYFQF